MIVSILPLLTSSNSPHTPVLWPLNVVRQRRGLRSEQAKSKCGQVTLLRGSMADPASACGQRTTALAKAF